eukprot:m.68533 g.68533  ORF g.68533 m.68533 type:complete len:205 (+) comp14098_c0_seq43:404-1018(+)
MHTSNIVSSLNPLTDVAGSGRYETLLKVFQPTIAHIDSSVMDDAFKEELMSDRVPRHENGRVVRHGWDKLAKAINTVLGMYEAGMVVTAVQVRNRYEHVKRASVSAQPQGRPRKITDEIGKEVRAFVDEENLKDGVTVKELALRFGVCERTMQDYVRAEHDLRQRVQSIKIKPRIDWAKKSHVDHWYVLLASELRFKLTLCMHA